MEILIISIQILSFYFIFLTISGLKIHAAENLLHCAGVLLTGFTATHFLGVWGALPIGLYFLLLSYFKNGHRLTLWDFFCSMYSLIMNSFLGYITWDIIMIVVRLLLKNTSVSPEYPGYFFTALAPPLINWLIVHFGKKWRLKKALPDFEITGRLLLIVVTCIMAVILFILYPILSDGNRNGTISMMENIILLIAFGGFFTILLFFIIHYIIMVNKSLQRLKKQHLDDLLQYSRQMEQLYDEIRGFRHDYANLLISLEQSIYSENLDEVKEIYEKVIKPTGRNLMDNKYSYSNLSNIKIPELKSLISAKLIMAEQHHLDVRFELSSAIHDVYMDSLPLLRILSILQDNAIEAAALSTDKILHITFMEDEENQIFDIRNSIDTYVDITHLSQKGQSTKGNNRGLGLFNVNELLLSTKYAMLVTEQKEHLFIQKLILNKSGYYIEQKGRRH